MEAIFHILGTYPDGHFHLDLIDLFVLGNVDSFWLWARYWFTTLTLYARSLLWM